MYEFFNLCERKLIEMFFKRRKRKLQKKLKKIREYKDKLLSFVEGHEYKEWSRTLYKCVKKLDPENENMKMKKSDKNGQI